jgi:hypothetical protein
VKRFRDDRELVTLASLYAALLLMALVTMGMQGCASAPPNLSPVATNDYKKTQVIKVIDLVRDAAIDANAQNPPLISTATTRKIVEAHKTALLTIKGSDSGWASAVGVVFAQLSRDPSFLPAEVSRLAPYFAVVAQVLGQVQTS